MPENRPIDMKTLAPAVARILGPDWTATPDENTFRGAYRLQHHDGRAFHLRPTDERTGAGRLLAHGLRPDKPGDVDPYTHDIEFGHATMAPTKTPRQIANQLTRRGGLLPVLTAAYNEWNARVNQARDEEAQRAAAAEQLAAVPGISRPHRNPQRHRTDTAWHLSWDGTPRNPDGPRHLTTTPAARIEADTHRQDGVSVRIELTGLTADHAERVLRTLTTSEPTP